MFFGSCAEWTSVYLSRQGLNPYCNGRCSLGLILLSIFSYFTIVLILIVMEDVLWVANMSSLQDEVKGCLNPYCNGRCSLGPYIHLNLTDVQLVLILIVMEDVLWGGTNNTPLWYKRCLNPYCNGRCSLGSPIKGFIVKSIYRLNPYCNGRCSLGMLRLTLFKSLLKSLNPYCNGRCSLGHHGISGGDMTYGLNPYCNGRCSLGFFGNVIPYIRVICVLILIVMEDVLWVKGKRLDNNVDGCLNPYCNGRCSLGVYILRRHEK